MTVRVCPGLNAKPGWPDASLLETWLGAICCCSLGLKLKR